MCPVYAILQSASPSQHALVSAHRGLSAENWIHRVSSPWRLLHGKGWQGHTERQWVGTGGVRRQEHPTNLGKCGQREQHPRIGELRRGRGLSVLVSEAQGRWGWHWGLTRGPGMNNCSLTNPGHRAAGLVPWSQGQASLLQRNQANCF